MSKRAYGPRDRSLTRPVPVDTLSWTTNDPQAWEDTWRHTVRVCDYMGRCLGCGRRTYAFRDGENDPRGVLGDRAYWPVSPEDDETRELRACAMCANDEMAYRHIRSLVRP